MISHFLRFLAWVKPQASRMLNWVVFETVSGNLNFYEICIIFELLSYGNVNVLIVTIYDLIHTVVDYTTSSYVSLLQSHSDPTTLAGDRRRKDTADKDMCPNLRGKRQRFQSEDPLNRVVQSPGILCCRSC